TSTAARASGSGSRRIWPWVLIAGGLLAVGAIAGAPNQQGNPYDPKSNDVLGTKALVELLGGYEDTTVDITDVQPPREADIAIAFPGDIPPEREDAMRAWVARGNTLVVADPGSGLTPSGATRGSVFGAVLSPILERGECNIAALRNANTLRLHK